MTDATRRRILSTLGALAATGTATAAAASGAPSPVTTQRGGDASDEAALPPRDELEPFVDEVLSPRVGDLTAGLTVAIVEGDQVRLAKGYGQADAETGRPVRTDETTFKIGSVSKLITWTAVMRGVEDGRLALDEDVNSYLGDSAVSVPDSDEDPVTLGHLGTHTAGFESIVPGFVTDPADLTAIETALVENRPDRVRPPGEAVEYSNYGTMLAGHVVAEAYDRSFEEHVQSAVLSPLDMEHSTFTQPVPADHPGEPATPHAGDGESFATVERGYVNARPAGSMTATATDMARFMSAHLGDGAVGDARILAPETVARMHDRHYVRHPAVNNWRFGFYEHGPVGAGAIAHSGGTKNFVSELVLVPDRDVGVFLSYNTAPAENVLADDIDRILREYDLLPEPAAPTPTNDGNRRRRAESVTGEYTAPAFTYASGLGHVIGLTRRITVEAAEPGRLVTKTASPTFALGDTEWVETEPYVYREVAGSDVLAFDATDGDAQRMYVSSLPQTAYEPVPFHDRQLVTAGVVAGSLGGFALSLLGRGGAAAWRGTGRLFSNGDSSDDDAVAEATDSDPSAETPADAAAADEGVSGDD